MKKNTIVKIFLFILTLLWITTSTAVIMHSLYSAQIPIVDYSKQIRTKTISKALQQVLIKVSGNSSVITLPQIQTNIVQATSMVQSYSYSEQTDNNNQKILLLQVKFDAKSIQQILRNANQALWGKDRPLILVWLAITDAQGNSNIINNADPVAALLQDNANRRGLPIILPMLDLEDLGKVSIGDFKTINLSAIKTASQRYNTKILLVGDASALPNGDWQSKWSLLINGEKLTWNLPGSNVDQILATITDDVADDLATRYAVLSSKGLAQQTTIFIDGVNDLNTYVAVIKYLQHLSIVSEIQVMDTTPTSVTFRLTSIGDALQLDHVLKSDKKLIPQTDTAATDLNIDLTYKWAVTP